MRRLTLTKNDDFLDDQDEKLSDSSDFPEGSRAQIMVVSHKGSPKFPTLSTSIWNCEEKVEKNRQPKENVRHLVYYQIFKTIAYI